MTRTRENATTEVFKTIALDIMLGGDQRFMGPWAGTIMATKVLPYVLRGEKGIVIGLEIQPDGQDMIHNRPISSTEFFASDQAIEEATARLKKIYSRTEFGEDLNRAVGRRVRFTRTGRSTLDPATLEDEAEAIRKEQGALVLRKRREALEAAKDTDTSAND